MCGFILCFAVYILRNKTHFKKCLEMGTSFGLKDWFKIMGSTNVATVAALISKHLPLEHKQVTDCVLCLLHAMLRIKEAPLPALL